MKILMIYPRCPDTFWSFKYALKFVSKKASGPPLGLLTVAAMLPKDWEVRLCDMNVSPLQDKDIQWADYAFIGAMSIQRDSAMEVIDRCKTARVPIVAGGPLFSAHYEEFPEIEHLVLNEAELTLPLFLNDLEHHCAKHLYTTTEWADVTTTPIPRWDLIKIRKYATMNLQYSRGCPYDCEFCDITVLYGRNPRTKATPQLISELDSLYATGWRGNLFLVDDNFIGNKKKLKQEVLPAITAWMKARNYPFTISTEGSLNLADDEDLMHRMAQAGFDSIFVGIESPNEESLIECGKLPNKNRDLLASVRKIQQFGMEVKGGFILGFDNDPVSIFHKLGEFIQESGIVTAMVGLLNAPNGTKLHKRLSQEGRLLQTMSGDNTDLSMNFIPKMNPETLSKGYREILQRIYAPKHYYARVKLFIKAYKPSHRRKLPRFSFVDFSALCKSTVLLGILGKERFHYWKLFFWSLFRYPRLFPMSITYAIYGFHFRKVCEHYFAAAS